ncbi:hypothetical protein CC1G_06960 [Coprinopsis cinerea okayama7|uniref:Thaumatin-like protein n=1 Tax=Coprinopsis cinerea (strain Okayama-7 / 130 / ATCC MYA-4618 / FGSC 9003) TaxID=240176 RepID=A8NZU8_COPC7|nr:hypothetical protein CC1G_06960 [Coprinopsis cinerea okayama7\|eukprot:XP_001837754.2 hypothetical protein CC1G_06960 [Coprinopsis cinerea okayama7\
MKAFTTLATTLVLLATEAAARRFTVYNNCPFTIWPAIYTDPNRGPVRPQHPTGWEARPFTRVQFNVDDGWKAGRIWARRNCDFSRPGASSCISGGCNGGMQCTHPGVPPVSLAEFTLNGDGNQDFYDVSLVDGANLPVRISVDNANCPRGECGVDLGPNCPAPLRGPFDSSGFPLGCKSACIANLDGNPANSRNCCSGQFNTPATCPASGVQFYSYFKNNCPRAYAYAYDEPSGALLTCPGSARADYTVTFCP